MGTVKQWKYLYDNVLSDEYENISWKMLFETDMFEWQLEYYYKRYLVESIIS